MSLRHDCEPWFPCHSFDRLIFKKCFMALNLKNCKNLYFSINLGYFIYLAHLNWRLIRDFMVELVKRVDPITISQCLILYWTKIMQQIMHNHKIFKTFIMLWRNNVYNEETRFDVLFFENSKCLFRLFGFFRSTREFLYIWRRHHYWWRAANFDICSALMAIEQWGFFSVPHLLWQGASVCNGHCNRSA